MNEVDADDLLRDTQPVLPPSDVVIVHNVYEPLVLTRIVERLEAHEPAFIRTWFPEAFRAFFYGVNLTNINPEPDHYFAAAQEVNRQLEEVFWPAAAPAERILPILASLDGGGRPWRVAPGRSPDEEYMFGTIRGHLESGYIPPHFDARPLPVHLRTSVTNDVRSYVLMLGRPVGGGELEVYRRTRQRAVEDETTVEESTDGFESVTFDLPAGSLITFDSSKFLHRVRHVRGHRTRWTLCSFMAPASRGDAVLCWG